MSSERPLGFASNGRFTLFSASSYSGAFSSLTLPHALAQVVLLEQIYRAATLLTGHPYHRS